jgi:hypothetical protein
MSRARAVHAVKTDSVEPPPLEPLPLLLYDTSRSADSPDRDSRNGGGCCTKPSTKTWAALAVTVAEGAGSAEAGQGAPRASGTLAAFSPPPLERLQ